MLEGELEDLRKQQDQQLRHKSPTNANSFDVAGDLDNYSKQMTRVNHENIKLKSQLSTYEQLTDKLKRQIKLYAKKLNEGCCHLFLLDVYIFKEADEKKIKKSFEKGRFFH